MATKKEKADTRGFYRTFNHVPFLWMTQWLSWVDKNLLRRTNVPALLAFLVVIAGWFAAEIQARKNYFEAQRATIAGEVALLRADLEGAVNGPIQLVRGLIAAIETEPKMDQTRFAELASRLIDNEPSLRNIAAAPDMIIQMMYPIEGNEQAIGLDYNSIPEQRDAALRARDLGDLVLAGPVDLVQGGQGFIGRFPVFLRNGNSHTVFWSLLVPCG
ncbi:CHASE domain-containing protein [Roseovarius sp. D0-M9]|uniref:CHASE domain-containing protein n=1 Tax=Roseovarius sp. D0-M9 TaxID=3127117 RepID=UPI0030100943